MTMQYTRAAATMKRFKIDFYDSSYGPFGLYFRLPDHWWGGERWKHIDHFEKRESAMALYDKIKDLPEYLD